MVPEYTNNSQKATGVSYHRIPKDTSLRQAWMARIRRVNHATSIIHLFVRRISRLIASRKHQQIS